MNCKTCKYLHMGKKFNADDYNNRWTYCDVCTVLCETEKGYDAFALIIDNPEDDKCEMWEMKNDK